MRLILLKRLFQLLGTSFYILRRQGIRAFSNKLWGWLSGNRINMILTAEYIPHDPTPEILAQQRVTPTTQCWAIVTALYQPPPEIWTKTIQSILDQTYSNWKWYVVDGSPTLASFHLLPPDPRIVYIRLDENKGISANINVGLHCVTEEWIAMLDHDDMLAPHALYTLHRTLQRNHDADVLYSDYDKIAEDGRRVEPFYKFEWSPETLLCANIVTHLTAFRRVLLDQVGYLDSTLDGSQDWDLYLRFSETTSRFVHIPEILYHWRIMAGSVAQTMDNKPYARVAQQRLLENALKRYGCINHTIHFDTGHPLRCVYPYVSWDFNLTSLSIIVTLDDLNNWATLRGWLQRETSSITTEFIFIVPDQRSLVSAIVEAQYDYVMVINSSLKIEPTARLATLWQWFVRPNVGLVGGKVINRRKQIVHAGMHQTSDGDFQSYWVGQRHPIWSAYGTDCWYRNVEAVAPTLAMLPRKLVIPQLGDWWALCQYLIQQDYHIVYTPDLVAIDKSS